MGGLVSGIARFVFGAAIGAVAGVAAAKLFTPASYGAIRQRVDGRLNEIRAAGERAERETVAALQRSYQARTQERDH